MLKSSIFLLSSVAAINLQTPHLRCIELPLYGREKVLVGVNTRFTDASVQTLLPVHFQLVACSAELCLFEVSHVTSERELLQSGLKLVGTCCTHSCACFMEVFNILRSKLMYSKLFGCNYRYLSGDDFLD